MLLDDVPVWQSISLDWLVAVQGCVDWLVNAMCHTVDLIDWQVEFWLVAWCHMSLSWFDWLMGGILIGWSMPCVTQLIWLTDGWNFGWLVDAICCSVDLIDWWVEFLSHAAQPASPQTTHLSHPSLPSSHARLSFPETIKAVERVTVCVTSDLQIEALKQVITVWVCGCVCVCVWVCLEYVYVCL